jgi:hypothetical protein
MKLIILPLFFLIGCGINTKTNSSKIDKLAEAYSYKLDEFDIISSSQEAKWPSDYDCDAALWAGLAARAGTATDIKAALDGSGRTTRKPNKDCIVPSESASSTSNDMILGIITGLYYKKDLASLELIFHYGLVNNWVMGYPASMAARVVLKPNNIALLARAIKQLGGHDHQERFIPLSYLPLKDSDYPTHLQFISIALARDTGETNYLTEQTVQATCENNDQDALAAAICGDEAKAVDLLLGDYQYPSYVRGSTNYPLVHWLLVAKLILE